MKQLLVKRIRNLATTGRDRLSQNSKVLDSLAERIANDWDSKVVEFHTHVMTENQLLEAFINAFDWIISDSQE
jgi:hypothetical protein